MKNLKFALVATLVVGSINGAGDQAAVAGAAKQKKGDKDKTAAQAVVAAPAASSKGKVAKDSVVAPAVVSAAAPVAVAAQVRPSSAPEKIRAAEPYIVENPFIASEEATWFDVIKGWFGVKRCQEQLVYEKWKAAKEKGDLSVLTKEDLAILAQISVPAKQQFLSKQYQQFKQKGAFASHALYAAIEKIKQIAATGNIQEAQIAQERAITHFKGVAADFAALQKVMQQAISSNARDYALNPGSKMEAEALWHRRRIDSLDGTLQGLKRQREKEDKDREAQRAREDKELVAQQELAKKALENAQAAQSQPDFYFGVPAKPVAAK